MLLNIAEPSEILASIVGVNANLDDETHTIDGWRAAYRKELATARQQPDITIFNGFVNNLLERASSGEAWAKRYKAIMDTFRQLLSAEIVQSQSHA